MIGSIKNVTAYDFLISMIEASAIIPTFNLLEIASMYGDNDALELLKEIHIRRRWQLGGEGYSEYNIRGWPIPDFNERVLGIKKLICDDTFSKNNIRFNFVKERLEEIGNLCSKEYPILDVGTCHGELLFLFANNFKNYHFVGLEPNYSEWRVGRKIYDENCSPNILDWKLGTLCDLPIEEKYSIIIMQEVLEHTINPRELIDNAILRLIPDGLIIGTVPVGLIEMGIPDIQRCHLHQFTINSLFRLFGPRMKVLKLKPIKKESLVTEVNWLYFEVKTKIRDEYEIRGVKLF